LFICLQFLVLGVKGKVIPHVLGLVLRLLLLNRLGRRFFSRVSLGNEGFFGRHLGLLRGNSLLLGRESLFSDGLGLVALGRLLFRDLFVVVHLFLSNLF
jgi:hypothetical protein